MLSARRVIAGASGTPGGIRAMRYARDLAGQLGATFVIAHAWKPPGGELADRRSPSPILRELWQQAAWQRITASVALAWGAMPADVATCLTVVKGPAGPVLVELAAGVGDVLVVGAGRRGPLARIGHGRVSRYCLAHARCPVIAVPPADLARSGWRSRPGAFGHRGLSAARVAGELNRKTA